MMNDIFCYDVIRNCFTLSLSIAERNDIIFADMIDSYLNLTIKVLHGLTWVTRHCSDFNFVVKVDSDVFFNPFSLIDYLHLHNLFNDPQVEFLGKNDTE